MTAAPPSLAARNADSPARRWLAWGIGLVLLFAAGSKSFQAWHAPTLSVWLGIAGESALGLWLTSGACIRWSLPVAMLTFAVFAGASLMKIAQDSFTCGCFGDLAVPPAMTFSLDAGVVVLLLIVGGENRTARRRRARWIAGAAALTLAACAMLMAEQYAAANRSPDQDVAHWLGREMPILSSIDVADAISHGRWIVTFYRSDCARCQETIAAMLHEDDLGSTPHAFIEVPPFGSAGPPPLPRNWIAGALDPRRDWSIETPTTVELIDGQVTSIGDDSAR